MPERVTLVRILWYATYSDLLKKWEDGLLQEERKKRATRLDIDLLAQISPLNCPAFSLADNEQVYLFAQNLRFFWGISLPIGVRDPARRVADIARAVGLTDDEASVADLPPRKVAQELNAYHGVHPYLETLRLSLVNPGAGGFAAHVLRQFYHGLLAGTFDEDGQDEQAVIPPPRLELFAHTHRPLPASLAPLAELQGELYEVRPPGHHHHLAPFFSMAIRSEEDVVCIPGGDVNLSLEGASERAVRDLLAATPVSSWQPLAAYAERLGIDDLHGRILNLLAAKRGNHISDPDFSTQMAASAERVCELLAPIGGIGPETPLSQLYDLADQALTNIDALNDTQKNTNAARQKLRRIKAGQMPLWASYVDAIRISAGKRSGADTMLNAVRNHAAQVRLNPSLHTDVREFSTLLAAETMRLESQYTTYKGERGLVDFTDLEILFLGLLENQDLSAHLTGDFDLVRSSSHSLAGIHPRPQPIPEFAYRATERAGDRAKASGRPSSPFVFDNGLTERPPTEMSRRVSG